MNQKRTRQHEVLRVPQGWTGQDKMLIVQLENIHNDLYRIAESLGIDLDALREAKADKVANATSGNFAGLDANGNITDSGHKDSDYLKEHQDISGKADKVSGATSGHFAGLDASGNLTDSGHKHSDYITEHQDISGKADKVSGATNGNFAGLDAAGNLTDSGHKHSDYLTEHQDISGKADKVSGGTNGNFAALDGNGNLKDSGHKHSDYLTEHQDISGKADKATTVTAVTYDSVNKKFTITINGTTTDIVTVATLKSAMAPFTHGQLSGS